MVLNLGCIVEGHGDVRAVPVLIRRIQAELAPGLPLSVWRPWRIGRDKLIKAGELERAVERLARQLTPPQAILILLDADVECPRELGPELRVRAAAARPDTPTGIVLAKHEFEAWFLAAIESLRGHRGILRAVPPVPDPESVRDTKTVLTHMMEGSRAYKETLDQPALTAVFDMQLARKRSDSFDKCWRENERRFAQAARQPAPRGR